MPWRIATITTDPLEKRAKWAHSTARWLLVLAVIFGIFWRLSDSEYFVFVAGATGICSFLVWLAGLSADAAVNRGVKEKLAGRGLSEIEFIKQGMFVAKYENQTVWGTLIPEGCKRVGVWISSNRP